LANGDYYSFYKDFMEHGQDDQINTLMLIKAYEDELGATLRN
jgi:hypothetical protein